MSISETAEQVARCEGRCRALLDQLRTESGALRTEVRFSHQVLALAGRVENDSTANLTGPPARASLPAVEVPLVDWNTKPWLLPDYLPLVEEYCMVGYLEDTDREMARRLRTTRPAVPEAPPEPRSVSAQDGLSPRRKVRSRRRRYER